MTNTTARTPADGAASERAALVERRTSETEVRCALSLDRDTDRRIETGVPFLDHLLDNLVKHGRFGLDLTVRGDLHIDDHHTVEDAAIVCGTAFDRALGDRAGLERFATAYAPLDESLARCVVDLSGRPWAEVDLGLRGERLGTLACENVDHWLRSFATASRTTLHLDVLRGRNDHHRAEAAFKALALALRDATRVTRGGGDVPSTKGTL